MSLNPVDATELESIVGDAIEQFATSERHSLINGEDNGEDSIKEGLYRGRTDKVLNLNFLLICPPSRSHYAFSVMKRLHDKGCNVFIAHGSSTAQRAFSEFMPDGVLVFDGGDLGLEFLVNANAMCMLAYGFPVTALNKTIFVGSGSSETKIGQYVGEYIPTPKSGRINSRRIAIKLEEIAKAAHRRNSYYIVGSVQKLLLSQVNGNGLYELSGLVAGVVRYVADIGTSSFYEYHNLSPYHHGINSKGGIAFLPDNIHIKRMPKSDFLDLLKYAINPPDFKVVVPPRLIGYVRDNGDYIAVFETRKTASQAYMINTLKGEERRKAIDAFLKADVSAFRDFYEATQRQIDPSAAVKIYARKIEESIESVVDAANPEKRLAIQAYQQVISLMVEDGPWGNMIDPRLYCVAIDGKPENLGGFWMKDEDPLFPSTKWIKRRAFTQSGDIAPGAYKNLERIAAYDFQARKSAIGEDIALLLKSLYPELGIDSFFNYLELFLRGLLGDDETLLSTGLLQYNILDCYNSGRAPIRINNYVEPLKGKFERLIVHPLDYVRLLDTYHHSFEHYREEAQELPWVALYVAENFVPDDLSANIAHMKAAYKAGPDLAAELKQKYMGREDGMDRHLRALFEMALHSHIFRDANNRAQQELQKLGVCQKLRAEARSV